MFFPDERYQTFNQIPFEKFTSTFQAFILDVDNTIMPHNTTIINNDTIKTMEKLKKHHFKLCVVSNNSSNRISKFCQHFDLPCISMAKKPLPFSLHKAMKIMDSKKSNTAIIGDQMFTDILGGKLAGIHTILVNPLDPASEPSFIKFKRKLENLLWKY